jgi:hypothetical protein
MPGATTNQWYRWDRTQWSVATPPAQLSASNLPLAISIAWGRVPAPPALTKTQGSPSPAPIRTPPPPRVELAPEPPVRSDPRARPSELPEARGETPPAPSTGSQKRALPTDLPERGRTRGRTKPPDLPR